MSEASEQTDAAWEAEGDPGPAAGADVCLVLDLEGYEGPIDALLGLAREQKVDLAKISILALADQYLLFVTRARKPRLELAADYLVMAAWLAYLKSRLLLPKPTEDEEPSGAEMAAALKFQLQRLQAMREAGGRLMDLPRLGREVFARGGPVPLRIVTTTRFECSLYELLAAYGAMHRRTEEPGTLRIDPSDLYTVEDAIARLRRLLGSAPGWQSLHGFLPPALRGGLIWRSAVASTLSASLEMVREGRVELRQDGPFRPIYLRGGRAPAPEAS